MPSKSPLSHLPEELLLLIFNQLDSPPPSQLNNRREPSLLLTTNTKTHAYKDISLVSRGWRRIVMPLLFKYSRLQLDIEPRDQWSNRAVHSKAQGKRPAYDTAKLERAHESGSEIPESTRQGDSSLQWASRFHHCLQDYLDFIQNNTLAFSIQSFVVLTGPMFVTKRGRFPHQTTEGRDHRYQAAANFWYDLYSVTRPSRLAIVAPPADMACLTNSGIDTTSDWAFSDMEFHILELSVADAIAVSPIQHQGTPMEVVPTEYPGIADSSILKFHPWSHIGLNEGSFLKAYGTYEYFERGPPSLIYSIKDCLISTRRTSKDGGAAFGAALRSFCYTGILPFANHVDFRGLLRNIDELDIKLAPDPDFPLTDKDRIGKAELEDCWQEFFSAYRFIVEPFQTFRILAHGTPKLQKFVCRDIHIPALRTDLDDEFTTLCMPVWTEPEPGVFIRQELPPMYELEGQ